MTTLHQAHPTEAEQKTRAAVLWSSALSEPLTSLYCLFPFILYQELGATALQLGIFVMMKPIVGLFSLYWSSLVAHRQDRLISNIFWGGALARIPFFFFPLVNNAALLIALGGVYWFFSRGMVPAWMEVLKCNLPSEKRSKIYSIGYILGHLEGMVMAVAIGPLMDFDPQAWRWLFPVAAVIGIIGIWWQVRLPVEVKSVLMPCKGKAQVPLGFKERVVAPWRASWRLMKMRPDFSRFQWGFMLSGIAVMLIKPAEPVIVKLANLTYTHLSVAILILKGLGCILTSALWARLLNRMNIFSFMGAVFALVSLCIFCFLMAPYSAALLFIAYFVYGVWMAGSHLSWNLSGPIFAKDEDSSLYSGISVAMVGVRGAVGPAVGSALLASSGPFPVCILGLLAALFSAVWMWRWGRAKAPVSV